MKGNFAAIALVVIGAVALGVNLDLFELDLVAKVVAAGADRAGCRFVRDAGRISAADWWTGNRGFSIRFPFNKGLGIGLCGLLSGIVSFGSSKLWSNLILRNAK
jgi:hypothetical protein